jgi:hypothetical protein
VTQKNVKATQKSTGWTENNFHNAFIDVDIHMTKEMQIHLEFDDVEK